MPFCSPLGTFLGPAPSLQTAISILSAFLGMVGDREWGERSGTARRKADCQPARKFSWLTMLRYNKRTAKQSQTIGIQTTTHPTPSHPYNWKNLPKQFWRTKNLFNPGFPIIVFSTGKEIYLHNGIWFSLFGRPSQYCWIGHNSQ